MGDTRRHKLSAIPAILIALAVGFAAPASASFTALSPAPTTPAPTTASSLAASVETPTPSDGAPLSWSRTPTGPRPYFGARYYGSKIGRFTTVDPQQTIKENIFDPQRWNRYAYGRNNPLRFVDPDGRDWLYRTAMGEQYVQQHGDRSSFSVLFGGLGGDVDRALPQFQDMMATDITIASLISLGIPVPRDVPARGGVQANKAAGDAWSQAVGAELKATHEVAEPEITVRTQSGARTRLDWVTKDSNGTIGCVECKASSTAPLTKGQAEAHPEIARSGGVVAGKGKPGVPGGTVIPPTEVQVRRPGQ